ncbi:hypothetical protein [Bacteroides helcogenes]|uniref:Outer membrane protein beta-barrel domain-containing protein n=1 Tax=Bacteroides helcogenes (strain ATCC 35417 / DSM 20613 / JCM 6297 / CCUG 15421 / P 36-108) TaxID=693979 RepID=E6SP91_BACT6|nr:hypothetical protein [Bacteroides helcogenes]ADV44848.1 hypothetical protein Bache_2913 [Bacteroides helcogenes P 36-108]MDY5239705.1 hypothetical protein [Bacteroides helcogenes]
MKLKLFLLLWVTTFSLAVQAQCKNDKGFLLELTAGYAHASTYIPSETYINISPSLGYQFNIHWMAGFRMTFETRKYDFKIYSPYVRFNYLSRPKWGLFAEAQWNIARRSVDGGQCNYDEVGISFGGNYALTPHIKLIGRYLFIGYSTRREREKAYAGKHDFLLDGNIARLQAGLQLIF